ncbi:apolipoprotein N-acyltransferase [Sphingomicrobium astaxanthinifaciens]|uniref:apolipoprotein N-acyltransferase n=1 Tax=Sphingomicrobium astaxanthinifaciens TaxID=1227949 RepID=UPI001FCAC8DB|nr:apolipoprotein N-acyltransferase [Sphingomicrobium astaxanthinifaciens]MCJ7420696.1 apolipoprotein N-acyltransferase [Sphingomicrobium astaxanthinifaciens]
MQRLRALLAGPRAAPWLALLLGLVGATGFAPLGLWPLLLLSLAGLLALLDAARTLKRAALIGWLYGVGQFMLGLNWIATAFTFQSNMPAWLGWVAVLLLGLFLALYPLLAALLARWAARGSRLALPLLLAGGWAASEWLRSILFTGFAWNPLGVALIDTPLAPIAVWIGTYGLSAVTILLAAIAWWLAHRRWRPAFLTAAVVLLGLLVPRPEAGATAALLRTEADSPPAPPAAPPPAAPGIVRPVEIRIVQPDIGQADKWRGGFDQVAADRLSGLTLGPRARGPAHIVFWPEAAVTRPLSDERASAASSVLFERARALRGLVPGQTLVTGGIGLLSDDGATVTAAVNSTYVLTPEAGVEGRYDKAHLVPYGEYLPMRWLLEPLGLSRLAPGAFDFDPGPGPRPLRLRGTGLRMGVQICYEIIFSGRVARPGARPDFIFNPSNDAWFGAWGPPQHLAQARLRALEEGLPVIRSTPTGISALIDAEGMVAARIGLGERGVIDAGLPPPTRTPTLFSRFGNALPLGLALVLALLGIALARRPR